jgi:hypothetical protein
MYAASSPVSPPSRALALGSLAGIVVLKVIMLGGLYSRTPPFPPEFLSPFIGATLALAAFSAVLLVLNSRHFFVPTMMFAGASLLSYGPHKLYPGDNPFFFAQTPAVYPAIVVGSVLIGTLVLSSLRLRKSL